MEGTVLILIKASAAGIIAVLCPGSFYDDGGLAAIIIRIVETACYITI
jgi:hypothetical protein